MYQVICAHKDEYDLGSFTAVAVKLGCSVIHIVLIIPFCSAYNMRATPGIVNAKRHARAACQASPIGLRGIRYLAPGIERRIIADRCVYRGIVACSVKA